MVCAFATTPAAPGNAGFAGETMGLGIEVAAGVVEFKRTVAFVDGHSCPAR